MLKIAAMLTGCCLVFSVVCLVWAADRQLLLDNGQDRPVAMSVDVLGETLPVRELTVYDIQYQDFRHYRGTDLRALLEHAGFESGAMLMLVTTDGYSIHFDSSILEDEGLEALLAHRDVNARDGQNWQAYYPGTEEHQADKAISFDPFYLVWAVTGPEQSADNVEVLQRLPWPWQLAEIRPLYPEDYAAAVPPETAAESVQAGFEVYFDHCFKCHQLRNVGGSLGPALDRPAGLARVLIDAQLRGMITRVSDYYPASRMPDFDTVLSEVEIDAVITYLRWALAKDSPSAE